MATDDEIQEALTAIYSRLGVIDGKSTLNVRANQSLILPVLEKLVIEKSPIGQVYLLLDGKRTQTEIGAELKGLGLPSSHATVSLRIDVAAEHGIAELIPGRGAGNVYRQDPTMESILNLSTNIRRWLGEQGEAFPAAPRRSARRRKGSR